MTAPCPICGKPSEPRYRPFCSRRCADVDLARWLNESYRIPDEAAGEDDPMPDLDAAPPAGQAALRGVFLWTAPAPLVSPAHQSVPR